MRAMRPKRASRDAAMFAMFAILAAGRNRCEPDMHGREHH
jgi:hypothetical protein